MKRKSLRLVTHLRKNMTRSPASEIPVTLAAFEDRAEFCWGSLLSQDYQIDSVSIPVPDAGFVCGSVGLLAAADEKGKGAEKSNRFVRLFPFRLSCLLRYATRPPRKSLPVVVPVHLPSSKVTPPLTMM